MAATWISFNVKRPYGFCLKMGTVAILGLLSVFLWPMLSSTSLLTLQSDGLDEIAVPISHDIGNRQAETEEELHTYFGFEKRSHLKNPNKSDKKVNGTASVHGSEHHSGARNTGVGRTQLLHPRQKDHHEQERPKNGLQRKEVEGVSDELSDPEGEQDEQPVEEVAGDEYSSAVMDYDDDDDLRELKTDKKVNGNTRVALFDSKARYNWKTCRARKKHDYIPCVDLENSNRRSPSGKHTERVCPTSPVTCLTPLSVKGYKTPVRWPESKWKVPRENVASPELESFIKANKWIRESKGYLSFQQNRSEFQGPPEPIHYLNSIEEMVPDIEWGKNVRVVLEIGYGGFGFGSSAFLTEKNVLTLSLGLHDDPIYLARVNLERGFPTVLLPFVTRRLPFPSNSFDAIHCEECGIHWWSNGGKRILEMNRLLRPAGYFIISTSHESPRRMEAMAALTSSICWSILSHEVVDVQKDVTVYQKPDSNDVYSLRPSRSPVLCDRSDAPDKAWKVRMKGCVTVVPRSAVEEHGAGWPEKWPERLHTFPEWLSTDREAAEAETVRWQSIFDRSYLRGVAVDSSAVRNVIDMNAAYGGFAVAAMEKEDVWVMNVIPVGVVDTLPFIFERGLLGIYHDWCEPFPTHPRSYDLLHADHLFPHLDSRCGKRVVVEMDRMLRPGGWAVVRDRVETVAGLERLFKSFHWEILITFSHGQEAVLCARKTWWRPPS